MRVTSQPTQQRRIRLVSNAVLAVALSGLFFSAAFAGVSCYKTSVLQSCCSPKSVLCRLGAASWFCFGSSADPSCTIHHLITAPPGQTGQDDYMYPLECECDMADPKCGVGLYACDLEISHHIYCYETELIGDTCKGQ